MKKTKYHQYCNFYATNKWLEKILYESCEVNVTKFYVALYVTDKWLQHVLFELPEIDNGKFYVTSTQWMRATTCSTWVIQR